MECEVWQSYCKRDKSFLFIVFFSRNYTRYRPSDVSVVSRRAAIRKVFLMRKRKRNKQNDYLWVFTSQLHILGIDFFFLMMVFRSAMWKRSECRFFNISIYYCIQREACRVCVCVCACVCVRACSNEASVSVYPHNPSFALCSLMPCQCRPCTAQHNTVQIYSQWKLKTEGKFEYGGQAADRINGRPGAESAFLIRLRVREHVHSF